MDNTYYVDVIIYGIVILKQIVFDNGFLSSIASPVKFRNQFIGGVFATFASGCTKKSTCFWKVYIKKSKTFSLILVIYTCDIVQRMS